MSSGTMLMIRTLALTALLSLQVASLPLNDTNDNCSKWAGEGECIKNPNFMISTCPRSCRIQMKDENPECKNWAVAGECIKNPRYMNLNCAMSCSFSVFWNPFIRRQVGINLPPAPKDQLPSARLLSLLEDTVRAVAKTSQSALYVPPYTEACFATATRLRELFYGNGAGISGLDTRSSPSEYTMLAGLAHSAIYGIRNCLTALNEIDAGDNESEALRVSQLVSKLLGPLDTVEAIMHGRVGSAGFVPTIQLELPHVTERLYSTGVWLMCKTYGIAMDETEPLDFYVQKIERKMEELVKKAAETGAVTGGANEDGLQRGPPAYSNAAAHASLWSRALDLGRGMIEAHVDSRPPTEWYHGQPYIDLPSGFSMPMLGYGSWRAGDGPQAVSGVGRALAGGVRHIDTAQAYRNEKEVGMALAAYLKAEQARKEDEKEEEDEDSVDEDIPVDAAQGNLVSGELVKGGKSRKGRASIFVATKLSSPDHLGYEQTRHLVEEQLKLLQTDYIDLYLLHSTFGSDQQTVRKRMESWRALEEMVRANKIRSIGVSNFDVKSLQHLYDYTTNAATFGTGASGTGTGAEDVDSGDSSGVAAAPVPISVAQVKVDPYFQGSQLNPAGEDVWRWCNEHGVAVVAYSTFSSWPFVLSPLVDLHLVAIGARAGGLSPAQVLLRWLIDLGATAIPRSTNESRIRENLEVLRPELGPLGVAEVALVGGLQYFMASPMLKPTTADVYGVGPTDRSVRNMAAKISQQLGSGSSRGGGGGDSGSGGDKVEASAGAGAGKKEL